MKTFKEIEQIISEGGADSAYHTTETKHQIIERLKAITAQS